MAQGLGAPGLEIQVGSTGLSQSRNQGIGQAEIFCKSSGQDLDQYWRVPTLSGIPCARVVLSPGMPLVARGFQLQKIGMPFVIVLERVQFRLIPLRASPDSHSGLHMADQTKDTVSSFNLLKDQALSEGGVCNGLEGSGVGLLGAERL